MFNFLNKFKLHLFVGAAVIVIIAALFYARSNVEKIIPNEEETEEVVVETELDLPLESSSENVEPTIVTVFKDVFFEVEVEVVKIVYRVPTSTRDEIVSLNHVIDNAEEAANDADERLISLQDDLDFWKKKCLATPFCGGFLEAGDADRDGSTARERALERREAARDRRQEALDRRRR